MEEKYIIGTYSKYGIYKLKFQNENLSLISRTNKYENCSWLCKNKNTIYNIIEYSNNPKYSNGYIFSQDYNLSPINSASLCGKGPCHITLDTSRHLLYLSNYGDGSIEVFSLNEDNSIIKSIYLKKFTKQSHIHCILLSPDNNLLFVTNLGEDLLSIYEINYDGKIFDLKEISKYKFPDKSGPRHLVLDNNNIYTITENSLELYKLSYKYGEDLKLINKVSLLDKKIKIENDYTGSAIRISKDKKYIYTAIRGHNSISVFNANNLSLIQNISCFGKTPRDINFNQTGEYLFSANQDSDNITIFKITKKTGELSYKKSYNIQSPACILEL